MRVGVFVHQSPGEVLGIMDQAGLDLAQLHGPSTPSDCLFIGPERVIKAFWPGRHTQAETFQQEVDAFAGLCRYVLLDSGTSGGGHGQRTHIPWLSDIVFPCPWILAGGLGPGSVLDQTLELQPDGIDLNSGVESSPGIKDVTRIRRTLEALKQEQV
jgi:phosphoribosylanthranilate isomerase